jgi:hypothetical protein
MEVGAPSSEATYAEITGRYGARRLSELQAMLGALEGSLAGFEAPPDRMRRAPSERNFA